MISQTESDSHSKEVSESAYEYLLGEVLEIPCKNDDEDSLNSRIQILDRMGFNVGYRFVERVVSSSKSLGTEPLDIIKFICKEFWEEVFKKKVLIRFIRFLQIFIIFLHIFVTD
jgi:hypothetical protein